MAYVSKEDKAKLAPTIKEVLKNYNMKGPDFFNNDDAMTDYFNRSHYIEIKIGACDKPYVRLI